MNPNEKVIQNVLISEGASVDGPHMFKVPMSPYQVSAVQGHFACVSSVCFSSEYMPSTLENFRILQLKYNTAGLLNDVKSSSPPAELKLRDCYGASKRVEMQPVIMNLSDNR